MNNLNALIGDRVMCISNHSVFKIYQILTVNSIEGDMYGFENFEGLYGKSSFVKL